MVSILLTVLKIIGITILVILGLVLFMLLLVLFVPVRYNGGGSYDDGMFDVRLRASWLLHMVAVRGEYQKEKELHIYLKIFGITIYDNLRAAGEKSGNKKVKSKKTKIKNTKTKKTGEIQAASSEDAPPEDAVSEDVLPEPAHADDSLVNYSAETETTENNGSSDELTDSDGRGSGIAQKIKNFLIDFVNFFKNIKFTIHKVCDTMVRIKNNIKYYLKVLQLDSTKRAFASGQKQLVRVLKKLFPRKYRVSLHLGFDDPAVMGEVLAVWGMFYPLHLGKIDIQPEFEQAVMEGEVSFQGRVSVFVFARAACILFFDRDIRLLIKHLKRGEI